MAEKDWLTREDIDQILDNLSAADVIEAIGDGTRAGAAVAGVAFDQAAAPLGHWDHATARVRVSDFQYLSEQMGEVMNVGGPKSEQPPDSPGSAATGE